jgi:anaerobic selenocysteine-containing dehydrogenase
MTKLIRNHAHWGAFLAEVEDGRVVGVRPFEHDPDPSPMIQAVPAAVHSRTRIVQPMVREGWLKHGRGHGEGRGREPFVPVSWGRALDLVADELVRIKSDHGHDAIMAAHKAGARPEFSMRRVRNCAASCRRSAASSTRPPITASAQR